MEFRIADTADKAAQDYVFVEEDGSSRELTPDEAEYLATAFHPADGGRPYVKNSYKSRTPGGSIAGFLRRADLR